MIGLYAPIIIQSDSYYTVQAPVFGGWSHHQSPLTTPSGFCHDAKGGINYDDFLLLPSECFHRIIFLCNVVSIFLRSQLVNFPCFIIFILQCDSQLVWIWVSLQAELRLCHSLFGRAGSAFSKQWILNCNCVFVLTKLFCLMKWRCIFNLIYWCFVCTFKFSIGIRKTKI